MSADVQQALDQLAGRLGRSVVINDPAVVLLYSSRHFGDEDDVRVQAMLNRVAGRAAIGHVLDQGVARWSTAGRIPAKPEIGMRARWCVPLRWHAELLGLLMVIDEPDALSASDRARVDEAAQGIAALLVGERERADATAAATDAVVADLLDLDPVRRWRALAQPSMRATAPLRVVVLRVDGAPDPDRTGPVLRHAVRAHPLATVSGAGAAVVVAAVEGRTAAVRMVAEVAELAVGRFPCVAGVGPVASDLAEAWISRRHADLAARAVPHVAPGPVVEADDLGAFDVLLRIPPADLDPTVVPAPLRALLAADPRGSLVPTLESYLRHAGSAPAAADALHVHRTTLHYRLDRVRAITGCDLDDGETRLALHLGLKAARMTGLLAGEQNATRSSAPGP